MGRRITVTEAPATISAPAVASAIESGVKAYNQMTDQYVDRRVEPQEAVLIAEAALKLSQSVATLARAALDMGAA